MSIEEWVTQLPRPEKLRLMETLWIDLNQSDEGIESPEWHEVALRETERRVAAGEEEAVDWETAKRHLSGRG